MEERGAEARRRVEIVLTLTLLLIGALVRWRVSINWVYAGGDSYAFLKLADELHAQGRYALGRLPEPLYWGRPPLYPLFIYVATLGGPAHWYDPGAAGAAVWYRIQMAQIAVDVLVTGILLFLMTRSIAGRLAALLALALWALCPFTVPFTSAIFLETLAMAIHVIVAWLITTPSGVPSRLRWFAAGTALGLGWLLRPDCLLLVSGVCVAALVAGLRQPSRLFRRRLAPTCLALTLTVSGALLAIAPWAVRNTYRFGTPHLFVEYLDHASQPLATGGGYRRWMATWARTDQELRGIGWCFYDLQCRPSITQYPEYAFDSPQERARVSLLLTTRARNGITSSVSNDFAALASSKRAEHPVRTLLTLPLQRCWRVWVNAHDDLLPNPAWRPWLADSLYKYFAKLALLLAALLVASSAIATVSASTRSAAAIISAIIVARTMFLGWSYYPEPRYVIPVMPLGFALIALAAGAGYRLWGTRRHLAAATSEAPTAGTATLTNTYSERA